MQPESFDQICAQIPVVKRWYADARPISRVLGGAGLQNRWHHFSRRGAKQILGFFPVGEKQVEMGLLQA